MYQPKLEPAEVRTFIASLNASHRGFFLRWQEDQAHRLQDALQTLGRGLSVVSGLNGEALGTVLEGWEP